MIKETALVDNSNSLFKSSGSAGVKLLNNNFDHNVLRTNDVLMKDEWLKLDQTVIEVARQRLIGVNDLMSRGLTYPIANALGVTRVEWQTQSDMDPAEISMSGVTEGRGDRLEYALTGVPLPIVHKDFTINIRALQASRNGGNPMDTTQARIASKLVSEKLESILFNGASSIKMQGSTIYGYKTFPNRNTGSLTAGAWDATPVGDSIVADVLAMVQKAYDDHMYGPFVLYVPLNIMTYMGNDFKANSDKSIIQRVKEIEGIADVRPSENLTAEALLVQMSSDVVDMVDGIQPTVLSWESHGGMVLNYKVMAIMVPRFKSDYSTQCGIVHYT